VFVNKNVVVSLAQDT